MGMPLRSGDHSMVTRKGFVYNASWVRARALRLPLERVAARLVQASVVLFGLESRAKRAHISQGCYVRLGRLHKRLTAATNAFVARAPPTAPCHVCCTLTVSLSPKTMSFLRRSFERMLIVFGGDAHAPLLHRGGARSCCRPRLWPTRATRPEPPRARLAWRRRRGAQLRRDARGCAAHAGHSVYAFCRACAPGLRLSNQNTEAIASCSTIGAYFTMACPGKFSPVPLPKVRCKSLGAGGASRRLYSTTCEFAAVEDLPTVCGICRAQLFSIPFADSGCLWLLWMADGKALVGDSHVLRAVLYTLYAFGVIKLFTIVATCVQTLGRLHRSSKKVRSLWSNTCALGSVKTTNVSLSRSDSIDKVCVIVVHSKPNNKHSAPLQHTGAKLVLADDP
eukprot:1443948-Pleurochrysis_carterae.AAC.6